VFSSARPSGYINDKAKVVDPDDGSSYVYHHDMADDLPSGIYQTTLDPDASADAAPLYILRRVVEGFEKAREGNIVNPNLVTVEWEFGYDAGAGTHYDLDTQTIHLQGIDGDHDEYDHDVILHEYGHHFMWNVFEQAGWPPGAGCAHAPNVSIDDDCAWTEGFATYYQAAVQDNPNYKDSGQQPLRWIISELLEPLRALADEGDNFEFSVAGGLWDIDDPGNDGQDALTLDVEETWDVVDNYGAIIDDINEFHTAWHGQGNVQEAALHNILNEHEL
jgi:hypothetical protein